MKIRWSQLILLGLLVGCGAKNDKLPVFGRKQVVEKIVNGKTLVDTVSHKIANFSFVNQDSTIVTNKTFDGKIYVSDFFFTSCPTICPAMKKQMLRVYEKYLNNDQVAILSHTIDPSYDNVGVLKDYSERLGVKSDKWHFVTGPEDLIYKIGEESYMVTAGADEDAPGGYIHSGMFLLVDKERQIRGTYDGTLEEDVDVLINDIEKLLKEYEE
ncbi:MAG: SCO family protein [Cyclobacteriaceae bacterium]